MLLGFALTEHCNLRCPHCIRDDVTTVRSLDAALFRSVVDQAVDLYGSVTVSMTGGEPLLHPEFEPLIRFLGSRRVSYRFVSNGWHVRRIMPLVDDVPPEAVRLSLSGATRETHDAERGTGSFHRVLGAVALLTSRQVPTYLTMVVDRRDRHQLRAAADLGEALGCLGISFIMPQPVPGSVERGSDLDPEEWDDVVAELDGIAAEPERRCRVIQDYGFPMTVERPCQTFALERIYVDTRGRVCTCCQLSQYGFNDAEVVADLHTTSLAVVHRHYERRLAELRCAQAPSGDPTDPVDRFPCLRCARASGKLDWLGAAAHGANATGAAHHHSSSAEYALPVLS